MARRGAKRKNRGYTPGHKPVNDSHETMVLGTPELMYKRALSVGVELCLSGGKYEARWNEGRDTASLELHTDDIQVAKQRLSMVPRVRAHDGSLLHAWFFKGKIHREEYEAGKKFDSLAKRYRGMICAPNPDEGPGARKMPAPDDPEAFQKVRTAYDAAFEAMGSRNAQRAVANLLRNEACSFDYARDGLKRLAIHWGL